MLSINGIHQYASTTTTRLLKKPFFNRPVDGMGGGVGGGAPRAEVWARSVMHEWQYHPWMGRFAERWLALANGKRVVDEPFLKQAREIVRQILSEAGIDPKKVLPAATVERSDLRMAMTFPITSYGPAQVSDQQFDAMFAQIAHLFVDPKENSLKLKPDVTRESIKPLPIKNEVKAYLWSASSIDVLENAFQDHRDNVDGFGRCLLRFTAFSRLFYREFGRDYKTHAIDDFIGPLQLLKEPKMLESGFRYAEILFLKTGLHPLLTRCSLTVLPLELFLTGQKLFADAVARLAKTKTFLSMFTDSIHALAKIYTREPNRFNEGLDLVDKFYADLEASGIKYETISRLFDPDRYYQRRKARGVVHLMIDLYAAYSISEVEKGDVDSTHICTTLPVKIKATANSPDWFAGEMLKLRDRMLALSKLDPEDPDKFPALFLDYVDRIYNWGHRQLELSLKECFEIIDLFANQMLAGKKDKTALENLLYYEMSARGLKQTSEKEPDRWPPEKVAQELEWLRKEYPV